MRYVAFLGEEQREVSVRELSAGRFAVSIDDRTFEIDAEQLGPSTLNMLVGGQAYQVQSEALEEGGENFLVRGEQVQVEMLDMRKVSLRKALEASGGADGPVTVKSPMPGKVVAYLAQPGDEVKKGQGVVVVEAMKMENELKAPKDGTIQEIFGAVGDAVDGGAPLCVIE